MADSKCPIMGGPANGTGSIIINEKKRRFPSSYSYTFIVIVIYWTQVVSHLYPDPTATIPIERHSPCPWTWSEENKVNSIRPGTC